MAYISKITDLDGSTYDLKSKVTNGILYGEVDSTSTATAFTAQIPGITEYYDGLTILLRNGIVTSASGFTININGLGGKPSYSNMTLGNDITPTSPTRDTTIFNINYAMIFVYNTTVVSTGCWICYRGYDANTNTLGYQLRTNSYILKTISRTRYYRILFTSADNTHWVPANTTYDNSATSVKTPNPVPINPFGEIVYLGNSTSYVAEADVAATAIWQQYTFALGYSFNTTGAALTLTTRKPVYVKCAPQSDGSAIIDSTTPYVQELPSTDDGKIYILLGMAYSETNIELLMNHPVYYYKDGAVRLWTNSAAGSSITVTPVVQSGTEIAEINNTSIYAPINSITVNMGDIGHNPDEYSSNAREKMYSAFNLPNNSPILIEATSAGFGDIYSYIADLLSKYDVVYLSGSVGMRIGSTNWWNFNFIIPVNLTNLIDSNHVSTPGIAGRNIAYTSSGVYNPKMIYYIILEILQNSTTVKFWTDQTLDCYSDIKNQFLYAPGMEQTDDSYAIENSSINHLRIPSGSAIDSYSKRLIRNEVFRGTLIDIGSLGDIATIQLVDMSSFMDVTLLYNIVNGVPYRFGFSCSYNNNPCVYGLMRITLADPTIDLDVDPITLIGFGSTGYIDNNSVIHYINVSMMFTPTTMQSTAVPFVGYEMMKKTDIELMTDLVPTSGSTNPVSSGGVYDVIGDIETLLAAI